LDTGTIWIDNVELVKLEAVDEAELPADEPEREWVYDGEFFFILNIAVGGNWPGYPDQTTEFPTRMEIDYIKFFDQEGNLDWEDQFTGPEINEDYWTFEVGNGHAQGIPGWGNAELQYYTEGDNAWIEDEKLIIEAREEERSDEFGSYSHTSTRMLTRNKVSAKYGRVEVRAKLPGGGQGIWPAVWMLGENIDEVGWPRCGEIDIMEFLGQYPYEIHGTVHGPGHSAADGIGDNYLLPEGDFTDDFHIFILEWEEDEIRWFVNDEEEPFHIIRKTAAAGVEKGY
ncbi:MAG: family 16 glycosylhydrolase, partial [Bacillota bacterium]